MHKKCNALYDKVYKSLFWLGVVGGALESIGVLAIS